MLNRRCPYRQWSRRNSRRRWNRRHCWILFRCLCHCRRHCCRRFTGTAVGECGCGVQLAAAGIKMKRQRDKGRGDSCAENYPGASIVHSSVLLLNTVAVGSADFWHTLSPRDITFRLNFIVNTGHA
jgi:hypothetical protein